jgi:hypothetical protein
MLRIGTYIGKGCGTRITFERRGSSKNSRDEAGTAVSFIAQDCIMDLGCA